MTINNALGIIILSIAMSVTGCSSGIASSVPTAEMIYGTPAGVSCYLIRDETGRAVAGNCVKE